MSTIKILLNQTKITFKSLFTSLILLSSILTGIVSFQMAPSNLKDTLTNTPKVSATPTCPSGYTWNGSVCETFIAKIISSYSCPSGGNLNGTICNVSGYPGIEVNSSISPYTCDNFPNTYQVLFAAPNQLCIPNTYPNFSFGTAQSSPRGTYNCNFAPVPSYLVGTNLCVPNIYPGFNSSNDCLSDFGPNYYSVLLLCVPYTRYTATPNYSCPSGYTDIGSNCRATTTAIGCDGGQYLNSGDCTPCPAGSSCSGAATSPVQCPSSTYSAIGASSCTSCPVDTTSPPGSISADACISIFVTLSLRALLSGAYNSTTALLNTTLNTRNLLPTAQPFNVPGISYTGSEVLPVLASRATNITDWVLVEVRDGTTNNVVTSKACVVLSDGTIKDTNLATVANQTNTATNNITLSGLLRNTNYKIILRHRNHIPIATNTPITFDSNTAVANLDFTTNTNVKGANQFRLNPPTTANPTPTPIYGLRTGDANNDNATDATDRNLLNTSSEYDGIYDSKDLNLDSQIDATDRNLSQNAVESVGNL